MSGRLRYLGPHQEHRKNGAPTVRGGHGMTSRMSRSPAHRQKRDERGTIQIPCDSAFERATCPKLHSYCFGRNIEWLDRYEIIDVDVSEKADAWPEFAISA